MYQYKGLEDTIAAIITPGGTGGIGVVRLSGSDAVSILGKVFSGRTGCNPSAWKTFSTHYGWIRCSAGDVLDEVLVTLMRAPKSYTCEDVVEISCHGGCVAVRATLELCLRHGARLAQPGEFTKRAFLNGRIDLAQAEAVLDVIGAKTQAALRACERQLKGDLSVELDDMRAGLLAMLADIEAVLNFPEDDTQDGNGVPLENCVRAARARLGVLLATAQEGRILKEGIKVVICGRPNVGKSSLLNAFLRVPRAIVTDVAGTTRDVLEEFADMDGIAVNLADTAGILEPRDKIEQEAVRRSRLAVESADIVLLILDQSMALADVDRQLLEQTQDARRIIVLNKSDLPQAVDVPGAVRVSAVTREGLEDLKRRMLALALGGHELDGRGLVINDLRHLEALRRADEALARVSALTPPECAAEEIKSAVNALDEITGRCVDADVIDSIFARFCIGK